MGAWRPRPKSMSEKGYRKYMARKKTVKVEGQDYTLQGVSPRWYLENIDEYGYYAGGRRDTPGYHDSILRNIVVYPTDVKVEGVDYFADDKHGGFAAELKLISEIERFLTGKIESSGAEGSKEKGEK